MSQPPVQPPVQPGMPAQVAPKKSRKTLYIVLGVVLAFLLLCAGCGVTTIFAADKAVKEVDKAIASGAATPEAVTGSIGKPANDGNFQFTVTKVQCSLAKIGENQYLEKKAQGQFCVVTLKVKNVKKEPQGFTDSAQKAYVGDAVYEADSEAGLYANKDNGVLFTNINPGNIVTGKIVFDIPKGAKLTKLVLHDSIMSGGVAVSVR